MAMASVSHVTADRAKAIEKLVLEGGTTSQWLNAAPYLSCFCIAVRSKPASWKIEGLLPDQRSRHAFALPQDIERQSRLRSWHASLHHQESDVRVAHPIRFVRRSTRSRGLGHFQKLGISHAWTRNCER